MAYDFFLHPWTLCSTISTPFTQFVPTLELTQGPWIEEEHLEILNEKKKIESFQNQEEWEIRKKIVNPYELIFSSIDAKFPGLSVKIPLSRSYFKMVEMLSFVDFWSLAKEFPSIQTAHVCEGPGGFIQSLLEGAQEHSVHVSSVYAMTLKPVKAHIPGWRRSYHFLKRFPQIQLEYGEDNTGNILTQPNQKSFLQKTKQNSLLFTADGGFDFSSNYETQEETVFPLLLSSFTMGLSCLCKKGIMIIKLFDMYSQATKDLICGSALYFSKWTIYKPATSRPFNSERYFIGIGFLGGADSWIHHLQQAHSKPIQRLCSSSWPSPLMDCIKEQIKWQEYLQAFMIDSALNIKKDQIESILDSHIQISAHWCSTFNVQTIPIV
jgi:cap2 methyltransferase